jgi:hypothetical protein
MATPRGSPGKAQRRTIFLSPEETEVSVVVTGWAKTPAAISSRAANLVFESVGKLLDDGVGEEALTHLPKLRFDVLSCLASVRKRDPKQLAGANIFHPGETERAERMLDGLALRIENGRLELDGDRGFHRGAF